MSEDGRPQDEGSKDSDRPEPESPRSSYGTRSSPSYGKWGSGDADWTSPETQPVPPAEPTQPFGSRPAAPGGDGAPGPGYYPPGNGPQGYGPQGYGPPGYGPQGYGPQNYGGYPGYGPVPSRLRRTRGLATAVTVVSGLATVLMWVAAVAAPKGSYLYVTDTTGIRDLPTPVVRYLAIEIYGVGLLMLVAWILTSIWLSQVRENALVFNPAGQRRGAAWAWLGWIVPIVAFWFPKQILDDTIRATTQASGKPRTILTAPFWAAWVVWFLQFLLLRPLSWHGEGERLDQLVLTVRPEFQVIGAVLATVTFVLWALLVRQVSAAQDELVASGPAAPAPPPPPSGPGLFGG